MRPWTNGAQQDKQGPERPGQAPGGLWCVQGLELNGSQSFYLVTDPSENVTLLGLVQFRQKPRPVSLQKTVADRQHFAHSFRDPLTPRSLSVSPREEQLLLSFMALTSYKVISLLYYDSLFP